MKILITGAAGMLGHAATEAFLPRHAVFAYPRAALDVTDARAVTAALKATKPDWVIHCAAWTDVDGCERDPRRARRVNVEGTRHIVEALSPRSRLAFISTDYVFDGRKKEPYLETDRPAPLNVYGKTKLAAERMVARALPERALIIRTSWTYGEHGSNFVTAILSAAARSREMEVVSTQKGSPTYAFDLARQMAFMIEKNVPPGLYHATNRGECSRSEFARAVLRAYNITGVRIKDVPDSRVRRPAKRPANSRLANDRLLEQGIPLLRHWKRALRHYVMRGGAQAAGA